MWLRRKASAQQDNFVTHTHTHTFRSAPHPLFRFGSRSLLATQKLCLKAWHYLFQTLLRVSPHSRSSLKLRARFCVFSLSMSSWASSGRLPRNVVRPHHRCTRLRLLSPCSTLLRPSGSSTSASQQHPASCAAASQQHSPCSASTSDVSRRAAIATLISVSSFVLNGGGWPGSRGRALAAAAAPTLNAVGELNGSDSMLSQRDGPRRRLGRVLAIFVLTAVLPFTGII